MKSERSEKLLNEIDTAIRNIKRFRDVSALEGSYLAKFLVVFISGTYEESIENIITELVAKSCQPEIASYTIANINKEFQNPMIEKIQSFLETFNPDWAKKISDLPKAQKAALDNIVLNKNAVAHGQLSSVTLPQVIEWYKSSRKIIKLIDDMVL